MKMKTIDLQNLNIIIHYQNQYLGDSIENIIQNPEILQIISNLKIKSISNFPKKIIFKELDYNTIMDKSFILSESKFSISESSILTIGIIHKKELKEILNTTKYLPTDFIIYYDENNGNHLYYQILSIFSNIITIKSKYLNTLEKNNLLIQEIVKVKSQEVLEELIHKLAVVAEYKDEYTENHIKRISYYSNLIATELKLDKEIVKNVTIASKLHDLGKIAIPDSILLKPGRLTKEEFEIMKTHTIIGAKILSNSNNKIVELAKNISLYHHEKYDGSGYPFNLKGKDIPIEARIVAIADVFDALTNKRPYKEPYSLIESINIIKQDRGKHFDPEITDIFLKNINQIAEIRYSIL